jgi:TonB-linked SusC/RagA family outer membrane protein
MKKTIFYIVLATLCLNFGARAQTAIKLIGSVFDTADNKPLHGATVKIKSTGVSTSTNEKGEFTLSTTEANGVLTISFVGYKTIEISFSEINRGPFKISLIEDKSILKEVSIVSTGYQTLPKERATGSFAQVDNQLLDRRVSTDLLGRLDGVVPGLLFNRNTVNGQAGQSDISIRGVSTLFANNQPLIVVDGFPYNGDLANINPNDVESITVLKDAAAASIWGVRSGNGVIVITTKKGRKNQPLSIELNANITVSNKPNLYYNPNFLPSNDFINIEEQLFSKGFYDRDLSTGYKGVSPVVQILADQRSGRVTDAVAASQINSLRNIDVRNDLSKYFYKHATNQQYALNIRGGNEKSDYFFSLGKDHNQASQTGNLNDRITINSLYNFSPVKDLTVTAGYNYIQSYTRNNSPIGSIITTSPNAIYPYAQLVDANGNALSIVHDYAQNYVNTAGSGRYLDWNYRPLDELKNADNTIKSLDNRLNFGVGYKFLRHFSADLKYQYERAVTNAVNDYNLATYYARDLINRYSSVGASGNLTTPIPVGGILQQSNSYLTAEQGRGQLNFHNTWNQKHELNAIVGFEIGSIINESDANTSYGYDKSSKISNANINYVTSYPLNPNGSATIPTAQGFGKTTGNFISYYSNAAYTYGDRYTFSLSGRIDKSNLFGVNTNQKAVPLYSAGFAWDAGKESFYHLDWLPYLKLRATYGYTGNINTSVTAVTTLRQFPANYNPYANGNPYNFIANPGNPELRWEKVRMINLGIDFAFKKQVVSGSVEYYFKKGTDLFGNSPLAPSTGLTTFFGNTADINGRGIDIVINSRNIRGASFSWTTNFLFSQALDKVTRYDAAITSGNYIALSNASTINPLAGNPLYSLYSYRWAGLTHDTGDPQGYLNGKVSRDYAGILSQTTIKDMVYSGSARPTIFGAFRNTFSYKQWTLSANITYKLNYYFRKTSYGSSALPWQANKDYFERWQKPGDELKTHVPSLQQPPFDTNRDAFYQYSSALIDRGDHIRLQDIRLSYELDKSKIKGLPFSHLSVYSYINNLGIIWRANRDHLDPDLVMGSSLSSYPLPRTYALGIKANF